ncbi:unnamed protein product [Camellia sinensis]
MTLGLLVEELESEPDVQHGVAGTGDFRRSRRVRADESASEEAEDERLYRDEAAWRSRTWPRSAAVAAAMGKKLLYLDAVDPNKDIVMYVNSPGGSVTAGMAIFDTMRHIRPDVSTVCVGLAASMGAFLLSSVGDVWTFLVDGAWKQHQLAVAFAWLYFDSHNREVARRVQGLHLLSPLMAEAPAVLDALCWARV